MDCGLITKKYRVSLEKMPDRTGMGDSWPLDLDLAVLGTAVRRSNPARWLWIRRSRFIGKWVGGGAVAGLELPAAARRTKLTGVHQNGAPGVNSTGIWVREVQRITCD